MAPSTMACTSEAEQVSSRLWMTVEPAVSQVARFRQRLQRGEQDRAALLALGDARHRCAVARASRLVDGGQGRQAAKAADPGQAGCDADEQQAGSAVSGRRRRA
ncbi:hypothetical protein ABZ260_24870 [Streptosporangium sp. NPDC006013]|uniref:hypothetical protein n=1 Tax=Streptosporangium sp. NPDC006013 TaxID=3155596 RepID=UPI0033AAF358